MHSHPARFTPRFHCLLGAVLITVAALGPQPASAAAQPEFSKPVIDLGIVVSDLAKSVAFYTNAIGFKEVPGFKVSAERATEIGLTDNLPADIRVFVLGEGNLATRVKLMSFPNAAGKKPDRKYIHSTIGMSYLTLYVSDVNAALKRLEKEKVRLLGKTPTDLGGGTWIIVFQDPDGNFIELVGPRVPTAG